MRTLGTYGGHLELSAFAHAMLKPIRIVQPGLVYVVACDDGSAAARAARTRREHARAKALKDTPTDVEPARSARRSRRAMRLEPLECVGPLHIAYVDQLMPATTVGSTIARYAVSRGPTLGTHAFPRPMKRTKTQSVSFTRVFQGTRNALCAGFCGNGETGRRSWRSCCAVTRSATRVPRRRRPPPHRPPPRLRVQKLGLIVHVRVAPHERRCGSARLPRRRSPNCGN